MSTENGTVRGSSAATVDGCFRITHPGRVRVAASVSTASCFTVTRTVKVTAKASPTKISKGKAVTVTGAATEIDWDTGRHGPAAGASAQLQYHRAKTSTWVKVATVKAAAVGAVKKSTKITRDGCYRFSVAATTKSGAGISTASCVDVR